MKKYLLAACFIIMSGGIPLSNALAVPISNYDHFSQSGQESSDRLKSINSLFENINLTAGRPQLKTTASDTTIQLEKEFRQYGQLENILQYAPAIIKSSPNNHLIHYLYSIALTVNGDIKKAKATIHGLPSDSESEVYNFLAKAIIAKEEKKYRTAINLISQAQKTDKTHPYPYNVLGGIHLKRNQLNHALKNFQKAASLSPNFYIAHTNAGVVQYRKGNLLESAASFQQALNIAPEYCAALIGHSIIAAELKDTNVAISNLKKCKGSNSLSQVAKKNLVSLYLNSDQLGKAEKQAQALLSSDQDFANLNLGTIYLRQGNIKKATKTLKRITKETSEKSYLQSWALFLSGDINTASSILNEIIKDNPEFIGAIVASGLFSSYKTGELPKNYLQQLENQPTSALFSSFLRGNELASNRAFSDALKNWKKSEHFFRGFSAAGIKVKHLEHGFHNKEKPYVNLGTLLYIQNFKKPAVLEFEKALKINPNSLLANYFLGLLHNDLGDNKKAITYLRKTLQTSSTFFSANYALAEVALSLGQTSMAIKHYNLAQATKNDVGVLVRLGLLHEANKAFKKAEKPYQKLISNFPNNFIGYNQLAWLYAKQGIKNDEALRIAKMANKLMPNNISILDTLGWIYVNKKDYTNALVHLQKAKKLSGNKNPDVLFHLAYTQNAMGKKADAIRNIKKALELSSSFETVTQAKQLFSKLENE